MKVSDRWFGYIGTATIGALVALAHAVRRLRAAIGRRTCRWAAGPCGARAAAAISGY